MFANFPGRNGTIPSQSGRSSTVRPFHAPLSSGLTQTPSLTGDIVHVDLMGQHMVILNRLEDAEELWSKRGQNYSDRLRPRFAMEM